MKEITTVKSTEKNEIFKEKDFDKVLAEIGAEVDNRWNAQLRPRRDIGIGGRTSD